MATEVSTINDVDEPEIERNTFFLPKIETVLSELSLINGTIFLKNYFSNPILENFDSRAGSKNESKLQMMLLVYNASLHLTSEDSETRMKLLILFDEIAQIN